MRVVGSESETVWYAYVSARGASRCVHRGGEQGRKRARRCAGYRAEVSQFWGSCGGMRVVWPESETVWHAHPPTGGQGTGGQGTGGSGHQGIRAAGESRMRRVGGGNGMTSSGGGSTQPKCFWPPPAVGDGHKLPEPLRKPAQCSIYFSETSTLEENPSCSFTDTGVESAGISNTSTPDTAFPGLTRSYSEFESST